MDTVQAWALSFSWGIPTAIYALVECKIAPLMLRMYFFMAHVFICTPSGPKTLANLFKPMCSHNFISEIPLVSSATVLFSNKTRSLKSCGTGHLPLRRLQSTTLRGNISPIYTLAWHSATTHIARSTMRWAVMIQRTDESSPSQRSFDPISKKTQVGWTHDTNCRTSFSNWSSFKPGKPCKITVKSE